MCFGVAVPLTYYSHSLVTILALFTDSNPRINILKFRLKFLRIIAAFAMIAVPLVVFLWGIPIARTWFSSNLVLLFLWMFSSIGQMHTKTNTLIADKQNKMKKKKNIDTHKTMTQVALASACWSCQY